MPTDNEFEVIFGADGKELKKTIGELEADLKAFNKQLKDVKSVEGLTALNKQIEVTAKNVRILKSANLGADLKTIRPGASEAANAMQNLGRVAQDLPFGFVGIQNNLNPLLESFQRLKAETGSTKTALASLGSSLAGAGGIGLALSAISAAFLIYQNGIAGFNKKTKEASSAFDEFAASLKKGSLTESLEDANKAAGEELSKLTLLAAASADVTRSTDERAKAVSGLQQVLSEYGIALSQEAALNGDVAAATDLATAAIIRRAKATAVQTRLGDIEEKLLDVQLQRTKAVDALATANNDLALAQKAVDAASGHAIADISGGATSAEKAVSKLKDQLIQLGDAEGNLKDERLSLIKIFDAEDLQIPDIKIGDGGNVGKVQKQIKDLTDKLVGYRQALATINDERKSNNIAGFKQAEVDRIKTSITDTVKQIKQLQALDDTGNNKAAKTVDLLRQRAEALKELITAGIDVNKNSVELKALEIKILLRDAKISGFTESEVQALIDEKLTGKYQPFAKIPVTVDVGVAGTIEKFDAAGDNLIAAQSRMYKRLSDQGKKDGDETRKKLAEPLNRLNEDIKSIGANAVAGFGDAIGDALAGGNPVAGFINVIAEAISALGKALIAYAAAKIAATNAIKSLNPYIALAAGIAAVAAGAFLRKKVNDKPRAFAEGGLVLGPTRALIGERGPELVLPLNQINSLLGNTNGSGGGTVRFEIEGNRLVGVLARANNTNRRIGG